MHISVLSFKLYELNTKVTDEPDTNSLSILIKIKSVQVVGRKIIYWLPILMYAIIKIILVRNEYICLILAKR